MRVLLLGCGNIGRYVYSSLSQRAEVTAVDREERCPGSVRGDALEVPLGGYDVVVNALPGLHAFKASQRAVEAGLDVVDVSYYPEDPLQLAEAASRSGSRYIPDAGVAPGLSNVLAGRAAVELEGLEELGIYVGGVPERPVGPLGYSVTWSPLDLIEEYTRPARVVEGGSVKAVEPLAEVELVETPLGKMEAFYTDGLRTLLTTIKAGRMYEKTLRWPGHVERIKLLRDLGFFSEEHGARAVTAALLSRLKFDVPDVVFLRVLGLAGRARVRYEVLVKAEGGWSAMQRATGAVAVAMVQLIKELGPGINPPEYVGMSNKLFPRLAAALKQHGIRISREYSRLEQL